jgi:hypothetical protein
MLAYKFIIIKRKKPRNIYRYLFFSVEDSITIVPNHAFFGKRTISRPIITNKIKMPKLIETIVR